MFPQVKTLFKISKFSNINPFHHYEKLQFLKITHPTVHCTPFKTCLKTLPRPDPAILSQTMVNSLSSPSNTVPGLLLKETVSRGLTKSLGKNTIFPGSHKNRVRSDFSAKLLARSQTFPLQICLK